MPLTFRFAPIFYIGKAYFPHAFIFKIKAGSAKKVCNPFLKKVLQ
jgi:hypothetical protein